MHPSITPTRVEDAVRQSMFGTGNPGFCHHCGEAVEGVEPDARNYSCDVCGHNDVFGAEETMFMM